MVLDVARKYAHQAQELVPDSEVILFGSQVKGCATKASDIDIAVVCEDLSALPTPEYRKLRTALWILADELDDRIEPHLISWRHEHSGFLGEILDTGIVVAEPAPQGLLPEKDRPRQIM